MPKYNYKKDALNAYMRGKISAKELDKIAKKDFGSSVATKKELQSFLDAGYMQKLMANTYNLKVPQMVKKVKDLMKFAESVNEASRGEIFSAAKKGSYPATVIVSQVRDMKSKIIKQVTVKTPAEAPATIKVLQKKYPKGDYKISLEDRTGKIIFKESVNEAMKPSQVSRAISRMKKVLMKKWQKRGGYENFGQRELDVMKDKLNYNPYGTPDERKIAKMLDGLDNWAMNYDGNMRESVINEISAEGGLKRVIKGQTREVEGIKLSVPMAQAMLDWFNSSPYGRKYPRAKKARLHLSLGIMMGFGLERYAKHKGAKDELKYIKTLAKAMREDNTLRESTIKHLKSLNEGIYSNKQDAMNAYMHGKISAEKLDKIAKTYFKASVATKQELQNFMKSGYMKELMANTYGLKVPAMEKKVKELMKYAS